MSLFRTIRRCTNTAVKLPFAMAWDCLSLGNMGDGASTSKVLREHEGRKQLDDLTEILDRFGEISRISQTKEGQE